MTKRDFQEKEYAEELRQDLWPEPPQENLFEDTSISALYLEKLAIAMFNQNIKGASYVEDIAYQLDSLGADYVRVVKSRDEAKTQANRFREDAAASARLMYTANSDCIDAQDECDKLRARVAELEKQLTQLWGVNCKPSGTDWLTKEDREKLLRLSYSLDYVQYATSADFIRSLLARLTPPEVRE
jgi:septal ring factor EnvC (AmiA/AmiB activator)